MTVDWIRGGPRRRSARPAAGLPRRSAARLPPSPTCSTARAACAPRRSPSSPNISASSRRGWSAADARAIRRAACRWSAMSAPARSRISTPTRQGPFDEVERARRGERLDGRGADPRPFARRAVRQLARVLRRRARSARRRPRRPHVRVRPRRRARAGQGAEAQPGRAACGRCSPTPSRRSTTSRSTGRRWCARCGRDASCALRARDRARARPLSLGDARPTTARCPMCSDLLAEAGFACERLPFGGIENLYARFGARRAAASPSPATPTSCRPATLRAGAFDPFSATLADGALWGRGAADMKGGVAAALAAALRFVARGAFKGSIALPADRRRGRPGGRRHGASWSTGRGREASASTIACSASRPASGGARRHDQERPARLADRAADADRQAGPRRLSASRRQSRSARCARVLDALQAPPLDSGTADFDPSNLEIVSVDVGNPATNVIPGEVRLVFNIRFNDRWTPATLERRDRAARRRGGEGRALRAGVRSDQRRRLPDRARALHRPRRARGRGDDRTRSRSCRPAAAPRTRASSRTSARWSSWASLGATMHGGRRARRARRPRGAVARSTSAPRRYFASFPPGNRPAPDRGPPAARPGRSGCGRPPPAPP